MTTNIHGAGIGLRLEQLNSLVDQKPDAIDFLELAPENWMNIGGRRNAHLKELSAEYPIICHGLSLSLGSPAPLNEDFLKKLKTFLQRYQVPIYSEHLSYTGGTTGQLYELIPIPFTEAAAHYVAKRIQRVQEILERRIAIENISYYYAPGQEMSEFEFINAVLSEADCDLLLDVNNIYVNSVNHGYSVSEFIDNINPKHIAYIHIAGHYKKSPQLIIDTHGAAIIEPVWEILRQAYARFGVLPTLLERDNDIPPLNELLQELASVKQIQKEFSHEGEPLKQQA